MDQLHDIEKSQAPIRDETKTSCPRQSQWKSHRPCQLCLHCHQCPCKQYEHWEISSTSLVPSNSEPLD